MATFYHIFKRRMIMRIMDFMRFMNRVFLGIMIPLSLIAMKRENSAQLKRKYVDNTFKRNTVVHESLEITTPVSSSFFIQNNEKIFTFDLNGRLQIFENNKPFICRNYKEIKSKNYNTKIGYDYISCIATPMSTDDKIDDSSDIILWDMHTLLPMSRRSMHAHFIRQISFDPTGNFFVSCSTDNTIILWSKQSREPLKIIAVDGQPSQVIYNSDGSEILSADDSAKKGIKVWDFSMNLMKEIEGNGPIAYNHAGSQFAVMHNNLIKIYEAKTYELKHTFKSNGDQSKEKVENEFLPRVNCLHFTPDDSMLVIGSETGDVIFCPLDHKQEPILLETDNITISSLAFDEKFLLTAAAKAPEENRNSTVKLWDLASMKASASLKVPKNCCLQ
jgi:WD40 repeat protein